jgi:hypothetical protein
MPTSQQDLCRLGLTVVSLTVLQIVFPSQLLFAQYENGSVVGDIWDSRGALARLPMPFDLEILFQVDLEAHAFHRLTIPRGLPMLRTSQSKLWSKASGNQ